MGGRTPSHTLALAWIDHTRVLGSILEPAGLEDVCVRARACVEGLGADGWARGSQRF